MVYAWMPGISRIRDSVARGNPNGTLIGGAPRVVWGTTESDPRAVSATAAAQELTSRGSESHLVWNPLLGEVVQLMPATKPVSGLVAPDYRLDRGREGRVCIVVQVVGYALAPFTEGELNGLPGIMAWLDSWGIIRSWPAGPPEPQFNHNSTERDERLWAKGGHFGHSQVPGADAVGPGRICPSVVLGRAPQPAKGPNGQRPESASATIRARYRPPDDFSVPFEPPIAVGVPVQA